MKTDSHSECALLKSSLLLSNLKLVMANNEKSVQSSLYPQDLDYAQRIIHTLLNSQKVNGCANVRISTKRMIS